MQPTEPVPISDQYLDDDDDDDDYLPRPASRRHLPPLTVGLLIGILATGAFFAGVEVQKSAGKAKPTNAAAVLATAGATGATGAAGAGTGTGTGTGAAGGLGGRAGGRTIGLVTNVQPGVISITDAQGAVVKISTTGNPAISKSTQGALSDIQIGNTIVVQGQPAPDGSVKATSITIGPPGGGGGFGGSGGGRPAAGNGTAGGGGAGGN